MVTEDGAINAARFQLTESRIGLAQSDQLSIQIMKLRISIAILPVELAAFERTWMIWNGQAGLHGRFCDGWELGDELEAPFLDRFFQFAVPHIAKISENGRGAELLPLKQKWRPRA